MKTHAILVLLLLSVICCYLLLPTLLKLRKNPVQRTLHLNEKQKFVSKKNISKHDKWIVVTSVNKPTNDIKKLAKLKGWKVLVVGDKRSPKEWSYPNCVFLDVNTQLSLGYQTLQMVKFNSYARKNIGYLFAIEHGAKIIYDTDDDNSPTTDNIGFDPHLKLTYFSFAVPNNTAENPYAHFGQSSIWPRGYPLDKIGNSPNRLYRKCFKPRVLVQQGVVNGDPDVDAIFRLTRKNEGVDLKIKFDSKAEPLLYPKNVIAPFNSQNTLHLYDAFWGLVIPQTVAFRVCDIWRGYWTQRLLWEVNGYLGFFAPNAYTYRNAHDYIKDFIDEKQMYHESSKFVDFLVNWKSTKKSFFERILELSIEMKSKGFWGENDVTLVKYWLDDLKSIGYVPPKISSFDLSKYCSKETFKYKPNEQPTSYLRHEV